MPIKYNPPEDWKPGIDDNRLKQLSILGKKHKMGSSKGRKWINNGIVNRYLKEHEDKPPGWHYGRMKLGNFDPSQMGSHSKGASNPNHSGLTDENILKHGIMFYEKYKHFRTNAWKRYAKQNHLPINLVNSRFTATGGGLNGLRQAVLNHVSEFQPVK